MYVRWLKRELTRTTTFQGRFGIGGHALSASLVENRRVAGRPRQRFVAHLATLRVWEDRTGRGDTSIAGGGRARLADVLQFWEDVCRKLDVIEVPFDRAVVEAGIARRVPKPPAPRQCSASSSSSAWRAPSSFGSVASARR